MRAALCSYDSHISATLANMEGVPLTWISKDQSVRRREAAINAELSPLQKRVKKLRGVQADLWEDMLRFNSFKEMLVLTRAAKYLPLESVKWLSMSDVNELLRSVYGRTYEDLHGSRQWRRRRMLRYSSWMLSDWFKQDGIRHLAQQEHSERLRNHFLELLAEEPYRSRNFPKDRILLCSWRKCARHPLGM